MVTHRIYTMGSEVCVNDTNARQPPIWNVCSERCGGQSSNQGVD